MKISKDHFTSLQESIIYMDALLGQALSGHHQYGFFRDAKGASTKIDLTIVNDTINATIKNLRLLLPSGAIVHSMNENDLLQVQYELDLGRNLQSNDLFLILTADPYSMIPFGQSENAAQTRKPFVRGRFTFELIECLRFEENKNRINSVPIAKITVDSDEKLTLQENFIPACCDLKALTNAEVLCKEWISKYDKLIATCSRILQQTLQNEQNILQRFCSRLADQLIAKSLIAKNKIIYSAHRLTALEIISSATSLAELFHLICNSWPDELRAKILSELQGWQESGVNPSKIKTSSTLLSTYKHFDSIISLKEAYKILIELHKYLMGIDANISNVRIKPEEENPNPASSVKEWDL